MRKQVNTSKNTSINNGRLPKAFHDFSLNIRGSHVCDYGCGKYTSHIRDYVCECGGLSYNPYDPYNMPELENYITAETARTHGYDLVFCCNVLNVIDSDDVVIQIVETLIEWCKSGGIVVIQIYEGDKSGFGKCTKKDCYQRNWKTGKYFELIDPVLPYNYLAERYGNYIVISDRRNIPFVNDWN